MPYNWIIGIKIIFEAIRIIILRNLKLYKYVQTNNYC